MPSSMKWALPSANTAMAPPAWNEKISSLGPQLLVDQGQSVGPRTGVLLLLIGLFTAPAAEFGGPETPLPVSGSAQRSIARLPLGVLASSAILAMSGYFDFVKGCAVSKLRPQSSEIAMVLLVPSVTLLILVCLSASAPSAREFRAVAVDGSRRPVSGWISVYTVGM